MGIYIELDMFQEGTSTLFQDMLHGCVYMEDMVITINYTYKKHMDILDDILNLLKNQGCRSTQLNASGTTIQLVI